MMGAPQPASFRNTEPAVATIDDGSSSVEFENVSVSYNGLVVLKPMTLTVSAGEILALIGPSGSGKTTALRTVAGFVRPATGRIRIGATDVTDLPPYERQLAMVVQNYALFPHMRVRDNVAFGLKARGAAREVIAQRVAEVLGTVGMSGFADRYPRELSGGQQQRVAIARALAVQPRVLLLDEPLSALDAQIRRQMVEEIANLHRRMPGLTILYVTHDQSEALTLADKIAIMKDGMVCAHGATAQLYRRPPNRFSAEFLGRANLLPASVVSNAAGMVRVQTGSAQAVVATESSCTGNRYLLCVRPHDLTFAPENDRVNRLDGIVHTVHWQGDLLQLTLQVDDQHVRALTTRLSAIPAPGSPLSIYFAPEDASLICESTND